MSEPEKCPDCGTELSGTGVVICHVCENRLAHQLDQHVEAVLLDYAKRGEQIIMLRREFVTENARAERAEAEVECLRKKIGTCRTCGNALAVLEAVCWPCHEKWEAARKKR